jgi:DNA sulfur modification protein DndD
MKLIDVTIHNFGPYYGEQRIEFGDKHPIIVIHGENMRGKTSLLNSIRWVLYGRALNRFGQKMNLLQLLNLDAAQEMDWTMQVKLNFRVEEIIYSLTRAIQLKKASVIPTKDSDFEEKLYLRKGNNHLNPDEAQTEINRILPETTSRFFLFDGELLNDYEVLLSQVEKQSTVIKDSIEQILGVPAMSNAISDFKVNLREAVGRQHLLAKKDHAAKAYAREASDLENEIDIMEFDLSEIRKQKEEKVIKAKKLNDELQLTAGIEVDAKRLDEYEKRAESLKGEEKKLKEEQRIKLMDAWQELLQPKILKKLKELEFVRDQQISKLQTREIIKGKLSDLQSLLMDRRCPTCGQTVINVERVEMEKNRVSLENQLNQLDYDEEIYNKANQSIRNLKQIKAISRFESIKYIERRLTEIVIELVDLEGRIQDLNDRLRSYDISSVIRNRDEYIRITKEIGSLETIIAKTVEILNQKKQEAIKLRAKIIKVGGPEMKKSNLEVQIYENLQKLFEKTLVRLRDDLRITIQNDATTIFKQLTTDKTYTGLNINDYFGLTILDINGNPVPERSAGAEQIVALSLIGALNKNAVRQGPIIMDTPFGRLDTRHRENILKFIPTLSSQVTLLVHGGEINKERDLAMIKQDIDREYEIRYITSRRSEIIPFREN